MHQSNRLAALKRVPILTDLPQARLEQVVGTCRWRDYDAGEQILSYQDVSTEAFFLAAGKVRIIIYSSDGKAVVFTDLKPGAMFGEISAIDRAPRSAGVEALEPSTIASLQPANLKALLSEPAVAVATLRHVTAEVWRCRAGAREFSTLVVQNRSC
jgi:CRP-like cAMP-binding protein